MPARLKSKAPIRKLIHHKFPFPSVAANSVRMSILFLEDYYFDQQSSLQIYHAGMKTVRHSQSGRYVG